MQPPLATAVLLTCRNGVTLETKSATKNRNELMKNRKTKNPFRARLKMFTALALRVHVFCLAGWLAGVLERCLESVGTT